MTAQQIPEYIEIRDVAGAPVAFLSPEADGLKDCWIDIELNHSNTLTFSLPKDSPKWAYITSEFRIVADGREFVILSPDAITDTRDGKSRFGKVRANESWILLGKKFITVSNDPQTPSPPWSAVILLSGGTAAGGFPQGSAGSALTYLLQGTDWSVGTVDVSGTHDLETEKESILANVNEVQEIWGGILVWDSINKTISLRDESTWQEYDGFQIRYAKNLKHIERTVDNDIITRLYPFGSDDLDISSVNGGKLYIENFQYTDEILEGKFEDQDIDDPQELKDKAIETLDKLSKPRSNYRVGLVDIRSLPEWDHEKTEVGDMAGYMADVIDEEMGIANRGRIIRHRYNVFQPWMCEIEVGDPIEKLESLLSNSKNAADYIKKILRPNTGVSNILKGIINTLATEINDSRGTYSLIDGVSTWFEKDELGELTGNLLRITPEGLIISSDGGQTWDLAISGSGGINASVMRTGVLSASLVQVGEGTNFEAGYDPSEAYDVAEQAATDAEIAYNTANNAQSSINSHSTNQSPHNLPSYCKMQSDGFKVFDGSNNLRCHMGQYASGKYGQKIIDGEIYSTLFRTGLEGDSTYVEMETGDSPVRVVSNNKTALELWTTLHSGVAGGAGGAVIFYDTIADDVSGYIAPINENGDRSLNVMAEDSSGHSLTLVLVGEDVGAICERFVVSNSLSADVLVVDIYGDLEVRGDLSARGAKPAIQQTQSYGKRYLYARESPDVRFIIEGNAELENGVCKIDIDPIFIECIEGFSLNSPHVVFMLTPFSESIVLNVAEVGDDYFIVKEHTNTKNIKFSWSVSALRAGFGDRWLEEWNKDELESEVLTSGWEDSFVEDVEIDEGILTSCWEDYLL